MLSGKSLIELARLLFPLSKLNWYQSAMKLNSLLLLGKGSTGTDAQISSKQDGNACKLGKSNVTIILLAAIRQPQPNTAKATVVVMWAMESISKSCHHCRFLFFLLPTASLLTAFRLSAMHFSERLNCSICSAFGLENRQTQLLISF